MKTHNGIAKVAAAAAMLLMASCSMPVQVPVQTQQQQQNNQTLIDQLRKLIPSRTQPDSGAQLRPWEEWSASPAALPQVVWPAPGAGDFETVQPAPPPRVNWPAPGAGDYLPVVIPDVLPSVIWPAPGAGDFQTVRPVPETGVNRIVVIPALLEPADHGKTDLIRVPGPADDCPIRPMAGPC